MLVSVSCGGSAQALALARRFATDRPDLVVKIVDVDEPGWTPPAGFAGTPMFYKGDTVISYGNPTPLQLRAAFPTGVAR